METLIMSEYGPLVLAAYLAAGLILSVAVAVSLLALKKRQKQLKRLGLGPSSYAKALEDR